MKTEIKKIINQCGCIDIKLVVLLFFLFAIIYAKYYKDEECNCN